MKPPVDGRAPPPSAYMWAVERPDRDPRPGPPTGTTDRDHPAARDINQRPGESSRRHSRQVPGQLRTDPLIQPGGPGQEGDPLGRGGRGGLHPQGWAVVSGCCTETRSHSVRVVPEHTSMINIYLYIYRCIDIDIYIDIIGWLLATRRKPCVKLS